MELRSFVKVLNLFLTMPIKNNSVRNSTLKQTKVEKPC